MYKQTKKDLIESVAERWKYQYFNDGVWYKNRFNQNDTEREDTYKFLLKAKTEAEIAEIIGNKSWMENHCAECGYASDHDEVVFLESTDEYGPTPYCKSCLEKALNLFK